MRVLTHHRTRKRRRARAFAAGCSRAQAQASAAEAAVMMSGQPADALVMRVVAIETARQRVRALRITS
jgi:phosphotransferase system  glucose/maltose/N-acetylglucosamine-specific IIC component